MRVFTVRNHFQPGEKMPKLLEKISFSNKIPTIYPIGEVICEEIEKKMRTQLLFFNDHIYSFNIAYNDSEIKASLTKVDSIIKTYTSDLNNLKQYLQHSRCLNSYPYIKNQTFLYNYKGAQIHPIKTMNIPRAELDLTMGEITLFYGYPKIKQTKKEDLDDIYDLIKTITGEKEFYTVMMWISQVVLEHRTGGKGRATLLMYGERGTGKNLLIELILKSLLPKGEVVKLPTNFKDFNKFYEKRIVVLDENDEEGINQNQLYKLAKEMSGATEMSINRKGIESYVVPVSPYLVVLSNEKPLQIKDFPRDIYNNQFIVIKTCGDLSQKPIYKKLVDKHGAAFNDFIADAAGAFIVEKLIPIYEKMIRNFSKTRYGFPININDDLIELCEDKTNYDVIADQVFEVLMNNNSDAERRNFAGNVPDLNNTLLHWEAFSDDGFVSNHLIMFFIQKRYDVSYKKVQRFVKKYNYWKKDTVKRIDDKSIRGFLFDKNRWIKERDTETFDFAENEKRMTDFRNILN